LRLFLAGQLPGPIEQAILALRAEWIGTLSGWRWVRPDAIHLTLRFLGEVTSARDDESRPAWRRTAAGGRAFRCALTRVGRFPARGSARVLWVGLEEREPGQALADLADRLEGVARSLDFSAETRPFHPHVTLARAVPGARPDLPSLEPLPRQDEGWVSEIVLFASRLAPGGSRYTALERFPLGPARPGHGRGTAG